MNVQPSSQPQSAGGPNEPTGKRGEVKPVQPAARRDISQAERAAMHPDPHDVEWDYYHGAWSH